MLVFSLTMQAMIKKIIQTTAPHRMEFLTDTVPDPEAPGTSSQVLYNLKSLAKYNMLSFISLS